MTLGDVFAELAKLTPGALAAFAALAGAIGAIVAATITAIAAKFLVGARDRQDREVEWRKHAIELTKLDLDRKLKTRGAADSSPLRPCILDFLANYRDLQELGKKTPTELYQVINEKRINRRAASDGGVAIGVSKFRRLSVCAGFCAGLVAAALFGRRD
jgi:hypothetical protein